MIAKGRPAVASRWIALGERAGAWGVQAAYLLPVIYLLVFFFYPLFEILRVSLAPEGALDLGALRELVIDPYYGRVFWFTTWQAGASTGLTLLLGLPAAYVFARYRFPGKDLLRALTTVPFVLPTLVVATAFSSLIGPRGWVNQALMALLGASEPPIQAMHTLWIILAAHVFYNVTIVIRIVGGFWSNLDPRVEEAARVLGASRWQTWRRISLPLLWPSVAAAALLVFVFCFTSFGVILVLGGPRFATLEVEIYRQTVHLFHLPVAAALALLQLAATFVVMAIYTRLQARVAVPLNLRPRQSVEQPLPRGWAGIALGSVLAALILLLIVPLVSLAARSIAWGGDDLLRYYRELFINRRGSILFVPPWESIRNSLMFAAGTVGLSLLMGVLSAYWLAHPRRGWRAFLDPVLMLPLGTSAVTLGFGMILALDEPPLNLRTSPLLVPIAHSLVAFPFVVRSLLPVLRSMNPHWREAAGVLGANSWQVWRRIDLPIVSRAVIVGAVFAFTISMGEFGATALIARPDFPTMPVAIYRFLGQPGQLNYGQAVAMSVLLMMVCVLGLVGIERFRYAGVGEF